MTDKYTAGVTFAEGDARLPNFLFHSKNFDDSLAVVDVARQIGEARGKTTAQVAVRWVLQQSGVTAALVGAKRPSQVEDNLGSDGWELSADELRRLDEISQQVHDRRTTETPFNLMIWENVANPFEEPIRNQIRKDYLEARVEQ